MKKTNRSLWILLVLSALVAVGCAREPDTEARKDVDTKARAFAPTSNLADPSDRSYVEAALKGALEPKNVDGFFREVDRYNASVGEALLPAAFDKKKPPVYDMGKIMDKRQARGQKIADTNCRINTFILLKDAVKIPDALPSDDAMLFMDKEALSAGGQLNAEETAAFVRLFSRVKTDGSKDASHQGRIMEKALAKVAFPEKASMVSVVLHDNLDGNYLFIGHVGVLVKAGEGYVFVEKISFEEPYQALKFPTKEACYGYLKEKFKDYQDPNVAPPFLMDNGRYVGSVR